jgi:hypothetical protein
MYQYGAEIGGCCSRIRRTVWIRDLVEGPIGLIGEPITTGKQPSKSHYRLVKIDDSSIHLERIVLTLVSRTFSTTAQLGTQYVCSILAEITQRISSNLPTIEERHKRKAVKMWVDLHSMPSTHPLAQMARRPTCKRFVSSMQRIAEYARGAPLNDLEATQPYISAQWDARLDVVDDADDGAQAAARAQETQGIRVATSASARNQLVGIGGAVESLD